MLAGCASTPPCASIPPSVGQPTVPVTSTGTSTIAVPRSSTIAADWPAPNTATPGDVTPGCTFPRPQAQRDVTAATKRAVAVAYGIAEPYPAGIEFDHRIPFALCGGNDPGNIWPERYDGAPHSAFVHNRKDELEQVIWRMVHADPSRLGWAQRLFRDDWRRAWCVYVHDPGVAC